MFPVDPKRQLDEWKGISPGWSEVLVASIIFLLLAQLIHAGFAPLSENPLANKAQDNLGLLVYKLGMSLGQFLRLVFYSLILNAILKKRRKQVAILEIYFFLLFCLLPEMILLPHHPSSLFIRLLTAYIWLYILIYVVLKRRWSIDRPVLFFIPLLMLFIYHLLRMGIMGISI